MPMGRRRSRQREGISRISQTRPCGDSTHRMVENENEPSHKVGVLGSYTSGAGFAFFEDRASITIESGAGTT
ncbi:hypothetical protein IF2G_02247 [Cordyceps javanica]|nr:hypothetical protein IF2G_02247 [Cordyceps javanica]